MRIHAAVFDEQDGPFRLQDVEQVLGHESAGVVTAVGAGVTSVWEGDHVVIGWPWYGECDNCPAGEPRYCARLDELFVGGVRPGNGASALRRPDGGALHGHFFGQSSFATHSLARADSLVKVPPGVPLDLLGGPAAAVMAARNSGATTIIAVDRLASRLKPAAELGATHTVYAETTRTPSPQCTTSAAGPPATPWSAPASSPSYARQRTPWACSAPARSSSCTARAASPWIASSPGTRSTRSKRH